MKCVGVGLFCLYKKLNKLHDLCVLLRMNSSTSNSFFSPRPHHLNYSSKSPPLPLVFETPLSALEILFQTNTISF